MYKKKCFMLKEYKINLLYGTYIQNVYDSHFIISNNIFNSLVSL